MRPLTITGKVTRCAFSLRLLGSFSRTSGSASTANGTRLETSWPLRAAMGYTPAGLPLVSSVILPAGKFQPFSSTAMRVPPRPDRKSTRLNSSHRCISYAVFCLKKKNIPDLRGQSHLVSGGLICQLAELAPSNPTHTPCPHRDSELFLGPVDYHLAFFFLSHAAPPGISPFSLPAHLPA